ncbi:MAG: hydantoinase B/oxoprolinase family protein [Caldilineaceae bacterium]
MDPITLELYRHRFSGIAEEMGITLRRTSYSPNIKERLDFSCAVFDAQGRLVAQAAHIPVHLGAMPASVQAALDAFPTWAPGDVVLLNDPYAGGSHLPDITMISPVFLGTGDTMPTASLAADSLETTTDPTQKASPAQPNPQSPIPNPQPSSSPAAPITPMWGA